VFITLLWQAISTTKGSHQAVGSNALSMDMLIDNTSAKTGNTFCVSTNRMDNT
jgi:hypothetical protein